jgi:protein TonB
MSTFAVPRDELPRATARALTAGVVAAHVAAGWALLSLRPTQIALATPVPIQVEMLAPPEPAPAPPPPVPAPPKRVLPQPTPKPVMAAAPSPAPAPFKAPPPPPEPPAPAPPAPAPATAVAAAPVAAPTPPPGPKPVPASALRYRIQPALVYPPLSARRGETGTVVLHVVVDVHGVPRQVSVKRSSGYPRLDDQALVAMNAARFHPCTDNGNPVECESTAPLAYDLDK